MFGLYYTSANTRDKILDTGFGFGLEFEIKLLNMPLKNINPFISANMSVLAGFQPISYTMR